jgi:phosphoglycolate phosphatase-like HAD superfamily hydrolase
MEIQEPREIKDIIWDADNTIWNWVRYAARAYQAMADCIVNETGLPESMIVLEMKKFYTGAGTLENASLVQGLEAQGLFRGVKSYDRNGLIAKIRLIFKDMRRRFLKKYPHVSEVMKKAQNKGINNIIVTDAPKFHAVRRIVRSKIGKLIKRAYVMPDADASNLAEDVRENIRSGKYDVPFEVIEIDVEKPDTNLEVVLRLENDKATNEEYIRRHVAIVGDNDKKDMELARKWGCLGIHALWGLPDEDDIITLKKISPQSAAARNAPMTSKDQAPPENEKNIVRVYKPEYLDKILRI